MSWERISRRHGGGNRHLFVSCRPYVEGKKPDIEEEDSIYFSRLHRAKLRIFCTVGFI